MHGGGSSAPLMLWQKARRNTEGTKKRPRQQHARNPLKGALLPPDHESLRFLFNAHLVE